MLISRTTPLPCGEGKPSSGSCLMCFAHSAAEGVMEINCSTVLLSAYSIYSVLATRCTDYSAKEPSPAASMRSRLGLTNASAWCAASTTAGGMSLGALIISVGATYSCF